MKIYRPGLLLVAVLFLLLSAGPAHADDSMKTRAVAAAQGWLHLVDQGKFAKSWTEAAAYLKHAVTEEQWLQSMRAYREPLGRVLSREVLSSRHTTTLPGAPDADYVVIEFRTSFENKKSAVETVTPMLGKDGKWRTSGYYIK